MKTDAQLLAEYLALDAQYAEADTFDSARAEVPDEDFCDESAELYKAALNRGQP